MTMAVGTNRHVLFSRGGEGNRGGRAPQMAARPDPAARI
jgi:hypothetical protein